uniref:Digeranylgeranylglyceryl phosphate synthase n=1 Tax=candidate division WOR-3 bacterium TaxID=2052148 RepID=A0A7V3RHD4_UNCW3
MKTSDFFQSLERHNIFNYIFLIITIIFIRIFFEGVLEGWHNIGYTRFSYRSVLMYFVHFPLFYITTFLFITLIITLILNESIKNVIRAASIGLILIIFVPVIDVILYGGCYITYPSRLEKYFLHFLNPFVSLLDIGISAGPRIIIVVISFFAGLYGYMKRKTTLKAILVFFSTLLAILFSGGVTTIIAGNQPENLYTSGGILYSDTQKFSAIYAIFFLVLFFLTIYLYSKEDFFQLINSIRPERIALYGGLGIGGFILARNQAGAFYKFNFFNSIALLFIFLSCGLGFWALQILNDFFDIKTDIYSKQRNPLLKGIEKRYYSMCGIFISVLVLIISVILNYQAFLIMFTFLLLGVIYSVPPLRLKRFPLLSTFILSIAVLLSLGVGYSVIYGEKTFHEFPEPLIYALITGITIGFSAKDMSDIEGDKNNGIITLPVLLYRKESLMGRLPYSLLLGLSYLLVSIFLPEVLPGSLVASVITVIYTLFRKDPTEKFYFFLMYIYGIYLFFNLIT